MEKLNNAEVIRNIVKLHEKWEEEHDGEELLKEKTYKCLKELVDTSTSDDDLNIKFNKMLKPSEFAGKR